MRELPAEQGYDLWAPSYDRGLNPLITLEESYLYGDSYLGDVRGKSVLDVGCGTGRHTARLSGLGARVTGVDFSEGMLAQARGRAPGVRFLRADLEARLPFEARDFDLVLCALVLDHIKKLETLFGEMRRVCHDDGRAIVTVMHPAVMLKGKSANFTDPETGEEIRPRSVPNSIADYVLAATRSGFAIEEMQERTGTPELAAANPKIATYLEWPLLLYFKLAPVRKI
jgi:malonyl-CoA O-methyltransferase